VRKHVRRSYFVQDNPWERGHKRGPIPKERVAELLPDRWSPPETDAAVFAPREGTDVVSRLQAAGSTVLDHASKG
jgi:hypothetical protein